MTIVMALIIYVAGAVLFLVGLYGWHAWKEWRWARRFDKTFCEQVGIDWKHTVEPRFLPGERLP